MENRGIIYLLPRTGRSWGGGMFVGGGGGGRIQGLTWCPGHCPGDGLCPGGIIDPKSPS